MRATPEVKGQLDPALWVRLVQLLGTLIGSNASTRVSTQSSYMYSSTHVVILCTALRQQLHTLLTCARPLCFSNVICIRCSLIDTIDICILKRAHARLPLRSLRLLKFKAFKHLATEQCHCVTRCKAQWPATSKKYRHFKHFIVQLMHINYKILRLLK